MTQKNPDKPLSVRHEAFCQAYVRTGVATQAYKDAGYNVSDEVAAVKGCQLVRNGRVAKRIAELRRKNEEAGELSRPEFMRIVGNQVRSGSVAAARLYAECAGYKEPEKIELKAEVEQGPATLAMLERSADRLASGLSLIVSRSPAKIEDQD